MIKYSVVIATADRPDCVAGCLAKVREQVSAEIEAIIVDGGKTKPIDEAALANVWPELTVLRSKVRNAGIQRNVGVQHARGEIIIFLDDDCYVQPGWWPGIVAPLCGGKVERGKLTVEIGERDEGGRGKVESGESEPADLPEKSKVEGPMSNVCAEGASPAAVAGGVWVNPSPKLTSHRGGYISRLGTPIQITHRGEGAPREVDWLLTTNMAVLKSVYNEIGGIPHSYGIYDEDVDLGLKIRRAGHTIVFAPESAIYHYCFERAPKPITKRSEFILGRNRSLLLVRHYGVFSRVWAQLLLRSSGRLFGGLWRGIRELLRQVVLAACYTLGALWGVAYGKRHAVQKDNAEYDALRGGGETDD